MKEILYTPNFSKEIKLLSKKYKSIKIDFQVILEELILKDKIGTSLGGSFYKVRMKISDKNKGKSSGARIITFYKNEETIYLLSIYNKSEFQNISKEKIASILKEINLGKE